MYVSYSARDRVRRLTRRLQATVHRASPTPAPRRCRRPTIRSSLRLPGVAHPLPLRRAIHVFDDPARTARGEHQGRHAAR
jgi:hypothetical protein